MDENATRLPLIGEKAPAFHAETTHGRMTFPDDYKGKWVILFSHPADFTPVCTTEFIAFAEMQDQFDKLNCELVGLSIDSTYSHIAWLRTIRERIEFQGRKNVEVKFPVIADLSMDVSRKYGMVHPTASATQAVRAIFVVDPEATIRALLYYPLSNGRNMPEILRLLVALQTTDKHGVATPANWQPGDDVIVPPPKTAEQADQRVNDAGTDYHCHDWFLCTRELKA